MAKKILIIDDDPVVVKYLGTLLGDNGVRPAMPPALRRGYKW
jgi:hypothetical protein